MRKQLRIVPRTVSAERVFAEQLGAQPASPLIRGLWFRVGTHFEWGLRLSVPYQPQLPTARNLVLVLIEPRHDLAELCLMCFQG
jgi:hypothetical protein